MELRAIDDLTPVLQRMRDAVAQAGLSFDAFSSAIDSIKLLPTTTGMAIGRVDDPAPAPKRAFALDGDLR